MSKLDRSRLISERDRLLARLAAIESDYKRGLDADSAERAVQLENAETLTEIQRVTQVQLADVLERLRNHEPSLRE